MLNAYTKKDKRFKDLSFQLKKVEKQDQIKPKIRRKINNSYR